MHLDQTFFRQREVVGTEANQFDPRVTDWDHCGSQADLYVVTIPQQIWRQFEEETKWMSQSLNYCRTLESEHILQWFGVVLNKVLSQDFV